MGREDGPGLSALVRRTGAHVQGSCKKKESDSLRRRFLSWEIKAI